MIEILQPLVLIPDEAIDSFKEMMRSRRLSEVASSIDENSATEDVIQLKRAAHYAYSDSMFRFRDHVTRFGRAKKEGMRDEIEIALKELTAITWDEYTSACIEFFEISSKLNSLAANEVIHGA